MLKNVIETLQNTNINLKNDFIQDSKQKPVNDSKVVNEENLKILKKFHKICTTGRKRQINRRRFNIRYLNIIFNAKFLLGLVSGIYMFCIVFTFFLSLYYEITKENGFEKSF